MINIKRAMKSNRMMKALTGMKIKEFNMLAVRFGVNLEKAFDKYRNVNLNLGRDFILISSAEKLFYILFYLKVYPTFDVASFYFNVDRSSCCRWAHWFIKALEMTLGKEYVLPRRRGRNLEEVLKAVPEIKEVFIDGTERPIRRPKDSKKQKNNYSGKKKRHTKKNIVVTTKKREILFLSKTQEGKVHDYRNFKDDNIGAKIPDDITVILDNGFQGIEKDFPDLKVLMPKRKPKGKQLTEEEKKRNKKISRKRVLVEHAIGGVKRFGIISNIYRNIKADFDDTSMLVACGLWNYHLKKA